MPHSLEKDPASAGRTLDLAGRRVLVVGAGRSGAAVARVASRHGAHVTVNDLRPARELDGLQAGLPQRCEFVLGSHPPELFRAADLVVTSPGVGELPALAAARAAGAMVIGELEFAARLVTAPIVAITGTNGKSTTTSLCGALLGRLGRPVFVGGNLGIPLSDAVDTPAAGPDGLLVVEASSFQLASVSTFRADVAVLLNIADDHLDRHGDRDAYVAAKGRVFVNQRPEDLAVTHADRPECAALAASSPARQLRFSVTRELEQGAFRAGDELVLRVDGDESRFPLAGLPLPGRPNQENMLAALLAASRFGLDRAEARETLKGFKPLPHRLQRVGAGRGLSFYDDSKGTNVAAAAEALCGLDGPAVLIAGGLDKGGDLAPLRAAVEKRARAVILIGAARERFAAALRGAAPLHFANDMREAVGRAAAVAIPGDAVLLSPACASFDMYHDFAHRGDAFQAAVREWLEA